MVGATAGVRGFLGGGGERRVALAVPFAAGFVVGCPAGPPAAGNQWEVYSYRRTGASEVVSQHGGVSSRLALVSSLLASRSTSI